MDALAEYPEAPHWLNDPDLPLPRRLLGRFIDSLDKRNSPRAIRINEKTAPELYRFDDPDGVSLQWNFIVSLEKDYGVIAIQYEAKRFDREDYEAARIRFALDKEDLVRHWLNRPTVDPDVQDWNAKLAQVAHHFEDGGQALADNIIRCERSVDQVLEAFAALGTELVRPVTLRALSARCFWGDSKFLEQRETLVRALYPRRSHNLMARPVLMNVHLPDRLGSVVFVENQDSFLSLGELRLPGLAVVYSAGFYGSAQRIRERDSIVFSYIAGAGGTVKLFESWWLGTENTLALPCYFWGDLDFSGMAILKALRNVFPDITAWRPGYQALLDQLLAGHSHPLASANKGQQSDPLTTGCPYADEVLLPHIRQKQSCVDQEALRLDFLLKAPATTTASSGSRASDTLIKNDIVE